MRCVAQLGEAGRFKGGTEFAGRGIVRVDEEDGDDVVCVLVHPVRNQSQPVLQRAGVEQAARGMAEVKGAVLIVHLRLEEAQARVEGIGGVEELVASDRVASGAVTQEGAIVRTKVRDLVVLAVAERG